LATIATVSPTELIRSTWGNSVATELNNACVKADGSRAMTGTLTVTAAPALKLRRSSNDPYLVFESTTGTRYGYVMGKSTELDYLVDNAGGSHRFFVDATERLQVDSSGVSVTGTLAATTFTTTTVAKFGGNGGQVQLIDTSTSGSDFHDVYMSFYGAGVSMVSPGTRTGYVGYASSATLQLRNEVANGGILLTANGSGSVALVTGSSGDITMNTGAGGNIIVNADGIITLCSGATERGRVDTSLMWGKTTSGQATNGVELFETGTIYSTTANNTVPNMLLRHNTNGDLATYIQFTNAAGTALAVVRQDDVAPVGISITNCATTAPSDYRLKNDLGPIVDAVARVKQLQPKHLAWKENGVEFDGFIAHELATVVPDAVHGDKDAVYTVEEAEQMGVEPGAINPQQLDQIPLIPLLTAALLDVIDRLESLEDLP
jgi:hypothetical protein